MNAMYLTLILQKPVSPIMYYIFNIAYHMPQRGSFLLASTFHSSNQVLVTS